MTTFTGSSRQTVEKPYEAVTKDPLLPSNENVDCGEEETWKDDLARLEDEILTLKSVLFTKEKQAQELKRKLGITPLMEFKNDISQGLQVVKESNTVQKTSEKIHEIGDTISSTEAYQKTNAAFKSIGAFASRKLEDIRNSGAFKSVEDKVGGAYTSVKNQFTGSQSAQTLQVSTP